MCLEPSRGCDYETDVADNCLYRFGVEAYGEFHSSNVTGFVYESVRVVVECAVCQEAFRPVAVPASCRGCACGRRLAKPKDGRALCTA